MLFYGQRMHPTYTLNIYFPWSLYTITLLCLCYDHRIHSTYTCTYTCMYTYVHIHVHIHTCTCTYTTVHVHIHTCTCTYMYTCTLDIYFPCFLYIANYTCITYMYS